MGVTVKEESEGDESRVEAVRGVVRERGRWEGCEGRREVGQGGSALALGRTACLVGRQERRGHGWWGACGAQKQTCVGLEERLLECLPGVLRGDVVELKRPERGAERDPEGETEGSGNVVGRSAPARTSLLVRDKQETTVMRSCSSKQESEFLTEVVGHEQEDVCTKSIITQPCTWVGAAGQGR